MASTGGTPRPRPLREWTFRLLLVAVGLGIGLLVAELAVRTIRPQAVLTIPNEMYRLDESGALGLRPGFRGTITNRVEFTHSVEINRAGLRGPALDRDGERPTLLLLGDSFVFGIGVEAEQTLSAQLAGFLEAAGTPVVALNGGVPGHSVPEEAARFERLAPDLDPDLVVLGIFIGNDLHGAANPDFGLHRGLIRRGRLNRSGGITEWLYHRSHLFVFLKTAVPSWFYERLRSRLGLEESRRVKRLRRELEIHRLAPTETVARGREATDRALERLVAGVEERGAKLAAFIVPTIVQIDSERWRAALQQVGLDPEVYDPHAPTRVFLELLADHGVPALDFTAPMAAAEAGGETVYYPIDRHWTPAGQRLAARLLAGFLAERGLLPSGR